MGVDLSATLPDLLARKGWTQERLADETGIRRTDINRLANGKIPAGRDRLSRIAAALEVSERELDPAAPPEQGGPSYRDRLEELEDAVNTLGEQLSRLESLDRQASVSKPQPPPRRRRGGR